MSTEFLPEHHEQPDEWHSHEKEGPPQAEHASQVNAGMLALAFLATVVSVVVVVVVITIYFNSFLAATRARKVETRTWADETFVIKSEQTALLDNGGEHLETDSTFTPIDQAMATVVRDYADMRADAN